MNTPTRYDLESKIYANFKTLEELQTKLDSGDFSFSTYRKLIQVRIRDLLYIDAILRSKGLNLESVTKEMTISNDFVNLIPKISNNLKFDTSPKNTKSPPILFNKSNLNLTTENTIQNNISAEEHVETSDIPDIIKNLIPLSSKITSDFITIIDFLKLRLADIDVLNELVENLLISLEKFPKLEELYIDIKLLFQNDFSGTINGDELYKKFEDFYLSFKKALF